MRIFLSIALLAQIFFGCKTTQSPTTSGLDWGSDAEKNLAVQNFENAIFECVPFITAVVPNAKVLTLRGDKESESVVKQFVNHLVNAHDNATTEQAAQLLELYKKEKGTPLPHCGGQAAEFVLSEFAQHSNLVQVVFGQEPTLKLALQY